MVCDTRYVQNEFGDLRFVYVFNLILSFSTCSQSFNKICTWDVLGVNVLSYRDFRETGPANLPARVHKHKSKMTDCVFKLLRRSVDGKRLMIVNGWNVLIWTFRSNYVRRVKEAEVLRQVWSTQDLHHTWEGTWPIGNGSQLKAMCSVATYSDERTNEQLAWISFSETALTIAFHIIWHQMLFSKLQTGCCFKFEAGNFFALKQLSWTLDESYRNAFSWLLKRHGNFFAENSFVEPFQRNTEDVVCFFVLLLLLCCPSPKQAPISISSRFYFRTIAFVITYVWLTWVSAKML